jgi:hypothetical protein
MRLERDVSSSQREAVEREPAQRAASEQPLTFQGLVLAASGARALGSEEWQSELQRADGEVKYLLDRRQSRQTPPSAFTGEDSRFFTGEQRARSEDEPRSLRPRMQIFLDPNSEERPPPTRTPMTRSRTRSQSTQPQISIAIPAERATEQHTQQQEQVEEGQDEETKAGGEEDPSPSASLTGTKKARKRPHYLSHEDRCQIIERIAGGEQQAALAREFGVTRAAVCHIQKHRFEILARPVAQPG